MHEQQYIQLWINQLDNNKNILASSTFAWHTCFLAQAAAASGNDNELVKGGKIFDVRI